MMCHLANVYSLTDPAGGNIGCPFLSFGETDRADWCSVCPLGGSINTIKYIFGCIAHWHLFLDPDMLDNRKLLDVFFLNSTNSKEVTFFLNYKGYLGSLQYTTRLLNVNQFRI